MNFLRFLNIQVIVLIFFLSSCFNLRDKVTISEIRIIGGSFHYFNDERTPEFEIIDIITIINDSVSFNRKSDSEHTFQYRSRLSKGAITSISSFFNFLKYSNYFNRADFDTRFENKFEDKVYPGIKHNNPVPPVFLSSIVNLQSIDEINGMSHYTDGWYNCIYIRYSNQKELFELYDTIFKLPIQTRKYFPENLMKEKEYQHRMIYSTVKEFQFTSQKLILDSITYKMQNQILHNLAKSYWDALE